MSRRLSSRVSKPIQRFSPERELAPAMQQQGSGRKRQLQSENLEIPLEARGTMQLMETLLRVTSSGEIPCLQCGSQISPTHERLLEHAIVVHENIGLFCCSVCDFGANSSTRILQHVRMEHLPEEKAAFSTVYDKYGIEFVNLTLANCYGKAVWIDDETAVMPIQKQSEKSLQPHDADKRKVEVIHRAYATAKVEQPGSSSVGFAADARRRSARRSKKMSHDEDSVQIYAYDAIDDDVSDEDIDTTAMKRQRRGSKRLSKQIVVSPMVDSELQEPASEFPTDATTMNAPNSKNFVDQHKLCQKCLKQIRFTDLFVHALSFHQKIPLFYCPICEHSADKVDEMLVHIHASHRDSDNAEPEGVRKILGDEFVDNVMRQCYGDTEEEVLCSAMHLREQGARYRRFICAQCFIQIPCKAEVMYHHLMKHATTLPYRCSLCYFGSKFEEQVQEHLIVRHLEADALSKKVLISAEVQATAQNLIDMASACFPQIFDAESIIGGAEKSRPRSAYHGIANSLITEIRKQLGTRENSAAGERDDGAMTSTGNEMDRATFSAGKSLDRHPLPRRPPRRNQNVVTAASIVDSAKMHPAVLEELEFIDSLVSEQSGRKREQASAPTSTTSYETLAMFGPPPPKRPIGPKLAINPLVEDENEEIGTAAATAEEPSGKSLKFDPELDEQLARWTKEDARTIQQFGVQPVFLCNLCDQLAIERSQSKNHLNKHQHICMLCQKFGCESYETLQEHWENVHDYTPARTDYAVPPFFERFMVCYMTDGQINCVLLSPKEIDDLEETNAGKFVGNLQAMSSPRFMSIIDYGTEVPGLRADSEFIEHMQLTSLADVTKEEVERNPHGPSLYFKGMYSSVYKRKLDRWFMQHNMDAGEDSGESGSVYCLEGRHLVTANFQSLTRHLFRHLKILPYYCSQCYFGAATVREVITHAREKSHNPSRISVTAMELGNPLLHMIIRELYGQDSSDMLHWTDGRCIQCPHLKTLNNIEAIQAHVADSHFPMFEPYFCSDAECLFGAESVQKVKDHIQLAHAKSAKETSGPMVIRNFGKMAMAFNQMLMRCFPHTLPPISNEIVFDSLGHSELIDLECSPRFADILMGIQIFNDFWWFTKEMAAEIPPKPSSFPMIEEKGVYKTIPCHPRRYTKDFDWMKGEQGARVHSDPAFDEYLICAWCEGMLIERRKSGSHISRTHPTVYECYICQAFKSDTHDHVRQHWMTVHGLSWEEVKGRVVRSQVFPRIYQECFADPKKRRIPVIGLTPEEFNNLESICIVHVSQETQWFLQRRLIYLPDKCRISVANKKDKAEVPKLPLDDAQLLEQISDNEEGVVTEIPKGLKGKRSRYHFGRQAYCQLCGKRTQKNHYAQHIVCNHMPYAKGRFYCSHCEYTNAEKMFVHKHIQQKHAGDGYPMTPWQRYHTEGRMLIDQCFPFKDQQDVIADARPRTATCQLCNCPRTVARRMQHLRSAHGKLFCCPETNCTFTTDSEHGILAQHLKDFHRLDPLERRAVIVNRTEQDLRRMLDVAFPILGQAQAVAAAAMDEDLSAANSLMVLQEEVIGSQQHPLSSQESTRRALLAKQKYSDAIENFPKRGRKKTGRRLYAPVKCDQCGFTTTEKDTRMCVRHALKHVNLERFYCPLCQFGAATHVEIIRHSETKHRLSFLIAADRVEHMIGNEKFCEYMVKCYGDDMGARIVKNYAQHQEWGFRAKICQVCHQPLQGLRELHIARYHFPFAKPYSCPVDGCEYDSRSESIFKDHFDKLHPDCSNLKPVFISERCPEAFQKMYDKCFPSEYRVLSPDERAQLIAENESYDAFLRETESQRHQEVTAAVSQFIPDETDSIDDDRLMGTPITIALPSAPDIGIIPGEQMGPMLFAPPMNVGRRPLETLTKKKRKEKKHRHHKKRKRHRRSRDADGESEDEAEDDSMIPNAVADPETAAAALMGLDETEAKVRRKAQAGEQMTTATDVEPRVLVEKV